MSIIELCNQYPEHYYLNEVGDNTKLVVVFGNAGCYDGVFPFYKTFQEIGVCPYLLISAKENNYWYSNGIPGSGNNLEDTLINLANAILEYVIVKNIETVFFTGTSMGGYPAILITHFTEDYILSGIEVKVLCFSTETSLFLHNSRTEFHNYNLKFKKAFPEKYADINDLFFFAQDITLYFGERCFVDAYCALLLRERQELLYNKKIRLISCREAGHMLVQYLNMERGYVKYLFEQYIVHNSHFALRQGNMADFLNSNDIKSIMNIEIDDNGYYEKILSIILKYPNYAFGLNRLGVCYEKKGDYEKAFKYLTMSAIEDASLQNTMVHLNYVREKR